ncbi:hypothetical protein QP617_24425, partial [Klebsiella quasipneumoniae]|uniref:hypothetical protein n=1 Tax=Klebsiella quasipneumoniae TaxID=1463165 RepID=UPI00254D726F
SVPAKHGPQPASMRAAPAFRERLSDFEAATPAVSETMVNDVVSVRMLLQNLTSALCQERTMLKLN